MASSWWLGAGFLMLAISLLLLDSTLSFETSGEGLADVSIDQDPKLLFETQNVNLSCLVDGTELLGANYTWRRDGGVQLTGSEDNVMLLGNTLTITSVTIAEWDGVCISCSVFSMTTMGSGSINLTVTSRSPAFALHPSNVTVMRGDNFTFNCSAVGLPTPSITLQRGGLPVPAFIARMISNGVYLFTDADIESTPGKYVCQATNDVGVVDSTLATVIVQFAPVITENPEDTDFLFGSTGYLNCLVRGVPEPTLQWTKNDEPLNFDDGRIKMFENGSLVFRDVMLNDTGSYACNASSELGYTYSDTAIVMVNVTPMFMSTPSSPVEVNFGGSVTLEVVVIAEPPADYVWSLVNCKTGNVIRKVTSGGGLRVADGSLTVEQANRSHRGCYRCEASNLLGSISRTIELQVKAPPLPPDQVRVDEMNSSWLHVVWTAVVNQPAIQYYQIEYRLRNVSDNWTVASSRISSVQEWYNLTQLYPNASYDIRLRSTSPLGVSDPSTVVMTTTSQGVPLASLANGPEDVRSLSASPNSITVEWTVPEVLLLTSYLRATVELRESDGRIFTEEGERMATFTGLTPAMEHYVSVTFIFAGNFSGPATRLARTTRTLDDVPGGAPNITSATPTSPTSINLTWTPPTVPNGNITYYTITTFSDRLSWRWSFLVGGAAALSYEITGLMAFTNYTISVSANTSAGEGPADMVRLRTPEDVPPPPSSLVVIALNSTALWLSWQPLSPEDVPGILTHYVIRYNSLDHGEHPSFELLVPTSDSDAVLVGLTPYTMYSVSIAAATGAGNGSFSNHTEGRTFGDVPKVKVQLVGLSKVCPSGLLVQWAGLLSKQLYGPIEEAYFIIQYTSLESGQGYNFTVKYYEGNTSYVIEGLDVFTSYSVRMALANINGTAPFSDSLSQVTCDGDARAPNITKLTAINSTAVWLSWQPLPAEEVPGVVVHYVVKYADGVEPIRSPASSSSLVISNLSPYTNYSISIATETRNNNTVLLFGAAFVVRTLGDVPAAELSILSVSPSCPLFGLQVLWLKPNSSSFRGPFEELSYVFFTNSSDEVVRNVSVPARNVSEVNDTVLSYIISDVAVDSRYSVGVALANINGTGPPSTNVIGESPPEGVPSLPMSVRVSPLNSTALDVSWQPPATPNGSPTYIIYYNGSAPSRNYSLQLPSGTTEGVITNLSPYTTYSVVVSAKTSCSETRSRTAFAQTDEGVPGAPENLRGVALPRTVTVKWQPPSQPRGVVTHYYVYCPGVAIATRVNSTSSLSHDCSELAPETSYEISVSAINGAASSDNNTINITTACEGSSPNFEIQGNEVFITVDADNRDCAIRPLFVLVVVQVVAIGSRPSRSLSSFSLSELIEATTTYNSRRGKRQVSDVEGVYIAANITEAELGNGGFTLGDGSRASNGYVNYRLVPWVMYNVGLRSQVSGTDTGVTVTVATPSEPITISPPTATTSMTASPESSFPLIPVAASAGAAGLVVMAICFVAIFSCCCRCCSRSLDKLEAGGGSGRLERGGSFRLSRRKLIDPVESFRNNHRTEALEEHPPIPVIGFLNKLSIMQTNDNQLFLEEFGSIDMAPQFSTDVANLPLNRAKNRYNNILPYDHSRVKLSSHKHSTDYINASYCAGYMKQKTYIATQGPIPESISDFWRMVWEQDSRTIIMLTNPFEKGKLKCEVYWPREVGASTMHGNIEVTLTDMTQLADYTIRNFTVHKGGTSKEPREIRHFHFTSWPDHGVPQYATAMLSMLRRVKAWQPPPEAGPAIIHCSAGVGRSGTYIVIDTMLERLKNGDDNVDIYGHVSLLRTQRPYMVQTEEQYFFIHEAVAEALLCGVTEVKVDKLHSYVQELGSLIPEDEAGHTHMELQFKRLALDRNDPNRFQTATRDANKSKNRYVNVLPYENNRVCLEFMRGVDGSDYINASHIDSYHTRRAFIATQGPLPNTVVDFWRMVWQYNAPVIVMLTECIEKGTERSACYWPTEVRTSQTFNKFLVEMAVERNSTHYSYRDLYITNTECHQRRLVRHFHFHSWPEVGVPSNPMVLVEFIREVQKLYTSLNTKSPLVIHCSNGVGRTGVFIALHVVLERLVVEGLADIFQTVKNLRIQRPAMVQSLDQYHFCYDATVDYIESTDMAFNMRQRSQSNVTTGSSESKRKSRPSNDNTPSRSPARSSHTRQQSGSLTRNTPARTESFKGSSRNLDFNQLGNGGSQIYGGSDGTSTFGKQRSSMNSSPPPVTTGSLTGSQVQLNSVQQNGNHGLSQQGLPQPLAGSQPHLYLGGLVGGGSQPHLNSTGGATSHSHQSSLGGVSQDGSRGLMFESSHAQARTARPAVAHQLSETQRYSSSSTNRSSYNGETQ